MTRDRDRVVARRGRWFTPARLAERTFRERPERSSWDTGSVEHVGILWARRVEHRNRSPTRTTRHARRRAPHPLVVRLYQMLHLLRLISLVAVGTWSVLRAVEEAFAAWVRYSSRSRDLSGLSSA